MKKHTSRILTLFLMMATVVTPIAVSTSPVGAIDLYPACSGTNKNTAVCKSNDDDAGALIKTVVNTLLYVLGTIAVIMIIVGGIRYATSGGDASGIKGGKDTILYAVIGLVVAMLAWAIVNFVIGMF